MAAKYTDDGVHPNLTGYAVMEPLLLKQLIQSNLYYQNQ